MWITLGKQLVAILIGNAIYFLLLTKFLPEKAHRAFKFDIGLVLDFWLCLVVYGLIQLFSRRKSRKTS